MMKSENFKNRIEEMRNHAVQFAKIVDIFVDSLRLPLLYDSDVSHIGFRYMEPTAKHFCTLKAVRAVSGLNASFCLAENGFNQEVCVIVRTIIDATSQIEFVMAGLKDEKLAERQQKVVTSFFNDFRRNDSDDYKGASIRQEDIHKEINRYFEDSFGNPVFDKRYVSRSLKDLLSNVYRNFSNYVHARYPEIMDMFGGMPPRFHMSGMSGTRKDEENLAILEAYTDSIAITLALMIQKFDMFGAIEDVPELRSWVKINDKN